MGVATRAPTSEAEIRLMFDRSGVV